MASLSDVIKEALKDNQEALDQVNKAIKDSKGKFVDLSEGGYVDKNKYSELETKYNTLKEAPNPLEDEIKNLKDSHKNEIAEEKNKLVNVVKQMAVEKAIDGLGLKDELAKAGVKSLINFENIKVDDNYNISGGLEDQISAFKDKYKTSFEQPNIVNTGSSLQTSQTNGQPLHQYSSLDEIRALSQEQVNADLANIMSQMSSLK